MASTKFIADIEKFKQLTRRNMRYVAVQSIQDVLEAAQTPQLGMTKGNPGFVEGKIPVAESELINSLSVNGSTGPESYVTAIAGLKLGDVLDFTWTAPHAMPMELGFTTSKGTKVPGRHYVGANAARFAEEFVPNRIKEVL